jgi:hypothetical protein
MLRSVPDQPIASDFTYHWLAVRALLDGVSPYAVIAPGGPLRLDSGYLYPLTAALVVFPFAAWLPPVAAAATFVGFSAAIFVWAITAEGYARLAAIGSIPFFWSVSSGQLSVLLTASALTPGLAWALAAKPNLALALFAYNPRRSTVILCLAFVILSLVVQPHWPLEWWQSVQMRNEGNYTAPIFLVAGFPLVSALLKWRRPEARLLFLMACAPQSHVFYDQLPLMLVPKGKNECMLLVITGFVGYLVASAGISNVATPSAAAKIYAPAIVISLYLPALVMVLRRPNRADETRSAEMSEVRVFDK